MENKNVAVAFLCFAVAISMGYTLYQQQAVIQKQEEDMALIKDHLEGLYTNSAVENSRTYTIMDTIIRIFHYAKPHKGSTWNCPECEDIRQESKGEKIKARKITATADEDQPETVQIGAETAALAVAIQNVHKHAVMRDSVIVGNILKTQHYLQMHKQKVRMCPDCNTDGRVAFKLNTGPQRTDNVVVSSRRRHEQGAQNHEDGEHKGSQ